MFYVNRLLEQKACTNKIISAWSNKSFIIFILLIRTHILASTRNKQSSQNITDFGCVRKLNQIHN